MSAWRTAARALVPRSVRNWLRSPVASASRIADEVRHRLGRDPLVSIRSDWQLRCHPAAWRGAYHVHADDPDQVVELDAFLATCAPAMVLFDLGAHYGLFSLAAVMRGGAAAYAIAVDPSPHAIAMVRAVARLNDVEDRITLVRAAAGTAPGSLDLVDVGPQALGYFVRPAADDGPRERTRVDVVSVDALVRSTGRVPTHLKVDVEGFEDEVLAGAVRTLEGQPPPIVFLELHVALMRAAGRDPAAPLELLRARGYTLRFCDGGPAGRDAVLARDLVRLVARA